MTPTSPAPEPDAIIAALEMRPHPEGGHYVETWRGPPGPDGRAVATAIHFLLRAGERSHWHRVDASEVWLHHGGAPLELSVADVAAGPDGPPDPPGRTATAGLVRHLLGTDLAAGQRPQAVVPAGAWQSATSTGAWSLVSCVVAPGFEFSGFELAPQDWSPTT